MKLSLPTRIGIIAGLLMIIVSLLIYRLKGGFDNALQYICYAIFAGSVIYSQHLYSASESAAHSLKNYFSEGFKTFIIIALLMVVFTRVFIEMTPGLTMQAAETIRLDLASGGNKTPAEINKEVELFRKNYANIMTSMVIFGYLAIGSLVALAGGMYFTRRKAGRETKY